MNNNTQQLLDLMHKHKLKSEDVAAMVKCTPNNVRVWRCKSAATIPDSQLELLKLKLGEI